MPRTLLTRADLDHFPDDGHRRELVDGVLLVSPMARAVHQRVVGNITHLLMTWIDEGGHGIVYPGVNVDLAADSHLEPDVAWSAYEGDPGVGFNRSPEFLVEVLSRGTRTFDRGVKKDRYGASGCRELWLVDIDARQIEMFRFSADGQETVTTHDAGTTFTSPIFPGLEICVEDVIPT